MKQSEKNEKIDDADRLVEKVVHLRAFHWGLGEGMKQHEKRPDFRGWQPFNAARIERCAKHLANGAVDLVDFDAGDLREQREACAVALDRVELQAIKAHGKRAEANYKARSKDWAALQRQRALLLVGLRKLNAAI